VGKTIGFIHAKQRDLALPNRTQASYRHVRFFSCVKGFWYYRWLRTGDKET